MIYVNGGIQKIYFYFSDLLKEEEEEEARGGEERGNMGVQLRGWGRE